MNEDEKMLTNDFNSSIGLGKPSFFQKNKKLLIV